MIFGFGFFFFLKYIQTHSGLSVKYFATHFSPILLLLLSLQKPDFTLFSSRITAPPFLPSFQKTYRKPPCAVRVDNTLGVDG